MRPLRPRIEKIANFLHFIATNDEKRAYWGLGLISKYFSTLFVSYSLTFNVIMSQEIVKNIPFVAPPPEATPQQLCEKFNLHVTVYRLSFILSLKSRL